MKAYKGFNADMTCRGFQFEEGKTYEHEGEVKLCESGFHACEDPLDIFGYYAPSGSEFHEVELEGVSDERKDDTKVVAKKITIGARLSIDKIIKACVEFRFSKLEKGLKKSGYRGVASNSGNYGVASNSGDKGVAETSGKHSIAISVGYDSKARGALGTWIVLAERDEWDGEGCPIKDVRAFKVDGEQVKADTWYKLVNGVLIEQHKETIES